MKLQPESLRAVHVVRTNAETGQRTVFVSGTFNIVHSGHLWLLLFAAECGDYLVVGVWDGRPIWESTYLGSFAAACQGRIGNVPLSAAELLIEPNKSNHFVRA